MESVKMAGARVLEKDSLSGVSRILSWISEGRERRRGVERKDFLSWMRASERRRELSDEPGGSAGATAPHIGERCVLPCLTEGLLEWVSCWLSGKPEVSSARPYGIGYFGQLGLVSLSEESDARTLLLYLNSGDISQWHPLELT